MVGESRHGCTSSCGATGRGRNGVSASCQTPIVAGPGPFLKLVGGICCCDPKRGSESLGEFWPSLSELSLESCDDAGVHL